MKKIFILFISALIISGCTQTQPISSPTTEIEYTTTTNSDGLTEVASTQCSLISDTSSETITLYTSAQKENGRFLWDDHARWVLEVSANDDKIYTLADKSFSNGSIYFDIVEIEEAKYIFMKLLSTAGNYTTVFTFKDNKLYETNELDLNTMKDKAVNVIYTSVPNYR